MAYQIGFDLYESATQDLLSHVRQGLRLTAPVPSLLKDPAAKDSSKAKHESDDDKSEDVKMEDDEKDSAEKEKSEEKEDDVEMKESKTLESLVSIYIFTLFIRRIPTPATAGLTLINAKERDKKETREKSEEKNRD